MIFGWPGFCNFPTDMKLFTSVSRFFVIALFFLIVHLNFFLTHKSRSAQFARSIVAMVMFLFAPDTGVGRNASLVPFHL